MSLKIRETGNKRTSFHMAALNREELQAWSPPPLAGTGPPSHMTWSLGFLGLVP